MWGAWEWGGGGSGGGGRGGGYTSARLSARPLVRPSVRPSARPSVRPSARPLACPFVRPTVYLSRGCGDGCPSVRCMPLFYSHYKTSTCGVQCQWHLKKQPHVFYNSCFYKIPFCQNIKKMVFESVFKHSPGKCVMKRGRLGHTFKIYFPYIYNIFKKK